MPSPALEDWGMGPGRDWGCSQEGIDLTHCPQGELPLTAIHINLEEKQTRSFLISGWF